MNFICKHNTWIQQTGAAAEPYTATATVPIYECPYCKIDKLQEEIYRLNRELAIARSSGEVPE